MISQIIFHEFFSVRVVENKNKLFIGSKQLFVVSEFEIGKLSDEFESQFLPKQLTLSQPGVQIVATTLLRDPPPRIFRPLDGPV
jgi:hypothetical protein